MFSANRRGMLLLYLFLGGVTFLTVASGAVIPTVAAVLMAAYMGFIAITAGGMAINQAPRSPRRQTRRGTAPRISQAAYKASEQATPRSNLMPLPYLLQDVGLIIDERRPDGVALRRARYISLEDESIRPYVVIHLPHEYPAHQIVVRFQMEDAAGEAQFIYEMPYKVRAGENLIVPDYRLPLKGNQKVMKAGTWDVEIQLDGQIIGVHHFSLLPLLAERLRQAGSDGEIHNRLMLEEEDSMPLSLEQLLKGR
jgi:hypothetical protein